MKPRVLFWVQHLLGIGHLVRASRVAAALCDEGLEVVVASGGLPTPSLSIGAARLVQLPAIGLRDGDFGALVGADGAPFDLGAQAARRDALLALFDRVAPDVLLTEAFPFGRRQLRFELLPLLAAARARPKPPLVVASVRDILQEGGKPGRAEETAALVAEHYDHVLVHGDPSLTALEATFPLAPRFAHKMLYGGIVGPAPAGPAGERYEVIVSVGGGAVGTALVDAALAARPLSRFREASWLVLTGPNAPAATRPPTPGVTMRAFAPDLPALLRTARVSISQAGYNTVADLLAARCRAVLVPFAAGGETEQTRRAALLADRGLAVVVPADEATPARLAAALDAAPKPVHAVALDGARGAARLLSQALSAARSA